MHMRVCISAALYSYRIPAATSMSVEDTPNLRVPGLHVAYQPATLTAQLQLELARSNATEIMHAVCHGQKAAISFQDMLQRA